MRCKISKNLAPLVCLKSNFLSHIERVNIYSPFKKTGFYKELAAIVEFNVSKSVHMVI
jgi:hypothetical protein